MFEEQKIVQMESKIARCPNCPDELFEVYGHDPKDTCTCTNKICIKCSEKFKDAYSSLRICFNCRDNNCVVCHKNFKRSKRYLGPSPKCHKCRQQK